jgi:hypothetical protein
MTMAATKAPTNRRLPMILSIITKPRQQPGNIESLPCGGIKAFANLHRKPRSKPFYVRLGHILGTRQNSRLRWHPLLASLPSCDRAGTVTLGRGARLRRFRLGNR